MFYSAESVNYVTLLKPFTKLNFCRRKLTCIYLSEEGILMKLLEYEAKKILQQYGIQVPKGIVVKAVFEVDEAFQQLEKPIVVKPQTLSKRRGKAGLIRFVNTLAEAKKNVNDLLGAKFRGETVTEVLLQHMIDEGLEMYMAVIVDKSKGKPVAILSSEGGIDIESIAEKVPLKIALTDVECSGGLKERHIINLTQQLKLDEQLLPELKSVFLKLYTVFRKYEAELVEINPLIVTKDRKMIAVDALIDIDDDALFRHPELSVYKERRTKNLENQARRSGLSFVKLEGNIGIIGNGAGLTMATADMVHFYGGRPAYFLDVRGGISADGMKKALDLVTNVDSKVVVINIFAGISRCDEVASGILKAQKQGTLRQPVIVRMIGTNMKKGRRILKSAGIESHTSMEEAIQTAITLAEEV